ncbi:Spermidine synthase [plant metagenome]|uniref:Spermidine synthase n=1 Tax=plant metagenome TaxID=1297885 RepID=A0A484RUU3_9ZZZZ
MRNWLGRLLDHKVLPRLGGILLAWGLLAAAPAQAQHTILHTEQSPFSPIIVYELAGERCMAFGTFLGAGRQTCQDVKAPRRMVFDYTRMMMSALLTQPRPASILVIGLGGGTLPRAYAELLPKARIDVVEIDPAVVKIARTFFGFQPSDRVRVHEADGRKFVQDAVRAGTRYDLVLLDAFDADYIPSHLTTREFLAEVKTLLAPGGVLAANTFTGSTLFERESATYAEVFGPTYNLRSGNRVILAANGPLPDDAALRRNLDTWKHRLTPYGVDLERELGRYGPPPDWPRDTAVLRDGVDTKTPSLQ